jgi:hypothetical protein
MSLLKIPQGKIIMLKLLPKSFGTAAKWTLTPALLAGLAVTFLTLTGGLAAIPFLVTIATTIAGIIGASALTGASLATSLAIGTVFALVTLVPLFLVGVAVTYVGHTIAGSSEVSTYTVNPTIQPSKTTEAVGQGVSSKLTEISEIYYDKKTHKLSFISEGETFTINNNKKELEKVDKTIQGLVIGFIIIGYAEDKNICLNEASLTSDLQKDPGFVEFVEPLKDLTGTDSSAIAPIYVHSALKAYNSTQGEKIQLKVDTNQPETQSINTSNTP